MHMVGHHDKRMRVEMLQLKGVVLNRVDHDASDRRLPKPTWAGRRFVQDCVGFLEGLRVLEGNQTGRKASVEAKRDEGWVVQEMNVGELAAVESHGYLLVRSRRDNSHLFFRWLRAGQGAFVGWVPWPALEFLPPKSESPGEGGKGRWAAADLFRWPRTGQGARPTKSGVTLLEMLVVVGIVSILMGVSYPSISASVDSVRLATAADSTAAFLNSALNRAEQRHQVLELTISKRQNQLTLRSGDPSFLRKLELPTGIRIAEILPGGDEEGRVFYLIPGGAAPRVGVQLVNARGAKRTVRVDPITGAPEIVR